MKRQKRIRVPIILSIVLVSLFEMACWKEPGKIELEIKQSSVGNAAYTKEILFFKMYNNREAEFDLVRNIELPVSESNLVRKKIILSEQQADQIRNILAELRSLEFREYCSSNERQLDVGHFTEIIFTNEDGRNRSIGLQGDIGQFFLITDERICPKILTTLLKKAIDIRPDAN